MLPLLLALSAPLVTDHAFGIATNGDLHRLDTANSSTTLVGNCGASEVFAMASAVDGALWTVAGGISSSAKLLAIDSLTGAGATVATLALGGSARGLAFDLDGSLLAVVRSNTVGVADSLKRVDMTSFSVTTIGSTHLHHIEGLCLAPEGTLYAWDIGSTGANGVGLVRLQGNGAAVDVGAALGDSDALSLAVDEFGRLRGVGRKLYSIDRVTGAKAPASGDFGVEFVGVEFVNAMTRLNGALALESNGTVSRVNLTTGAIDTFGSAGAPGFEGLALRQGSNEFWAIRDVGGHSEMWRIDPASGVGTYAFDVSLAAPRGLSCSVTGVLAAIDDGGGAAVDLLYSINTILASSALSGPTVPLSAIEGLSIDSNFNFIAWDANSGLAVLNFGGQATEVLPAQPPGAPLDTLMHDAFGRLFGTSDRLERVHIPSETRTTVGAGGFPQLAGMAPFRTQFFQPTVSYCTAQTNSAGCTPTITAHLSFSVPSVSAGSGFRVRATTLLTNKQGLFFYGVDGRRNSPFLGGTLCVNPPLRRTPVQSTNGAASACSGSMSIDFNTHLASGVDPALVVGAIVNMQAWSRDPASPSTTNLTAGLEFGINP